MTLDIWEYLDFPDTCPSCGDKFYNGILVITHQDQMPEWWCGDCARNIIGGFR